MPLRTAGVIFLLVLAVACAGNTSSAPSAPTTVPELDLSAIPSFSLDGCTPPSAETLNRGRCDPVNVVFPDTPFAEVAAALIRAGWSPAGFGTSQVVLPPGGDELLLQSAQLFKAEGSILTSPRYHIRLWQLADGTTIGGAHHETGGLDHNIDLDWEAAEAEVRDDLCSAVVLCGEGGVLKEQRAIQNGSQRWRGFRNDASPTVIRLTLPR